MKYLLFLLLTSCFHAPDLAIVQGPSSKKQKQKIHLLQKKLDLAQKEKKRVETAVSELSTEICQTQLSLIRRQIDEYERKKPKSPYLFLQERELLYEMIQQGPSPSSLDAQLELDRILRIITLLSDEDLEKA